MTLLILAAGKGSRYGGLKQFDGVGPNDQYLLEFNVYDAIKAGVDKIVLVVDQSHQEEMLRYLRGRLPSSIALACVLQDLADVPPGIVRSPDRVKPWGTAHAVWSARHVIDEPFVIVNADDLYGVEALETAISSQSAQPKSDTFSLVGYRLQDTLSDFGTVSRGVCKVDDGFLTGVVEYTKIAKEGKQIIDRETGTKFSGQEPTSMNLWVLNPSIFPAIENEFISFFSNPSNLTKGELYIPAIVQKMIDSGQTKTQLHVTQSDWYGMTYPEDKAELKNALKAQCEGGVYPVSLWT